MTYPPITYSLQEAEGRIDINAEVTEELALALEKGLEKLFSYYQYERVTIRINSPGGLLIGLRHMLECIDNWRACGREIQTEATFRAGSAAALLLALGEVGTRTVHRHTSVLFHHSRIDGTSSAITAGGANHLASILRLTDNSLLMRVADHVVNGMGGFGAICAEGLSRCEILRTHSDAIANALGIAGGSKNPRWLTAIQTMYLDGQVKMSARGYRRYLEKRLDQDTLMDLREAYGLNLIDRVLGVPDIQAFHTQHKQGVPRNRESYLQLAA